MAVNIRPVACSVAAALASTALAHPPDGFADRTLPVQFTEAVGLCFDPVGRMYVWEKNGRVWTVDDIGPGGTGGVRSEQPLIDLSEEVGNWGDHGLLGFALDPNFLFNGHIYLLYVVDYHHLRWYGTPQYSPDQNDYWHDTIGRLVRYTARASDGFRSVDPASRLVFIGDTMQDGFPVCHASHSAGSLAFGEDGTLLVSFGDGATYGNVDVGGPVDGWNSTCLADNIIRPEDEDVGALRSQLLSSLSGKVLRIDTSTGGGPPSNPFFDPAYPYSSISKVWAWGLRNPYRFTLRPKTGNPDPAAADPGTIYLGDVGWTRWEELNVAPSGGVNFGWPLFEGLDPHEGYMAAAGAIENTTAPNPLHDPKGQCPKPCFAFPDLLTQDTLAEPSWPNPCDPMQQVPALSTRATHTRPVLDWYHFDAGPARAPAFDASGNATAVRLDDPESPVKGEIFEGRASVGGAWVESDAWPEPWRNRYYHADFSGEWIRALTFDENDRLLEVQEFAHELGSIVDLEWDAAREVLWYIRFTREGVCEVRALGPDLDIDPIAVAEADPPFGPGPLSVSFKGDGSKDPEGEPLTYHWDFGDGSTSNEPNPVHVYAPTDPPGPARYVAELTVSDPSGQKHKAQVPVWVDNTPPVVEITSPAPGATMPASGFGTVALTGVVTDAEHPGPGPGGVTCRWLVILHHDTHTHLVATIDACDAEAAIAPHPCEGSSYAYEFVLQATDPLGLSASASRFMAAADCNANGAPDNCDIETGASFDTNSNGIPDECEPGGCPADFDHNGVVNSTDVSAFINTWFEEVGGAGLVTDWDANGVVNSTDVSAFINAYFAASTECLG